MPSVLAYGVYLPRHRLERSEIAHAYGRKGGRGQRSVAAHDEDSVTMGAEALIGCLAAAGGARPDRVYFASTTPPYFEKSAATLLSAYCDLPAATGAADFGGSLRAGATALRAACDAVAAGSARVVAVVVSDARRPEPGSDLEPRIGAGAMAMLIGEGAGVAEISGFYETQDNLYESWRPAESGWVQTGDPSLARTQGLRPVLGDVLAGVLRTTGRQPSEIAGVAVPTQHGRLPAAAFRAAGLDERAVAAEPEELGYAGAAAPFLAVAGWLERASEGETLLAVAYGDGAAGFLVRRGPAPASPQGLGREQAQATRPLGYVQYLRGLGLLEGAPSEMFTSAAMLHREEHQLLGLGAERCGSCGAVQYPLRRICWQCGATEGFRAIRLGRTGEVLTLTREHLYPSPEPPTTMAVISLDGGGRFFCQLCDFDPQAVGIGARVELAPRLLHQAHGIRHYFWKARPVKQGEAGA